MTLHVVITIKSPIVTWFDVGTALDNLQTNIDQSGVCDSPITDDAPIFDVCAEDGTICGHAAVTP